MWFGNIDIRVEHGLHDEGPAGVAATRERLARHRRIEEIRQIGEAQAAGQSDAWRAAVAHRARAILGRLTLRRTHRAASGVAGRKARAAWEVSVR